MVIGATLVDGLIGLAFVAIVVAMTLLVSNPKMRAALSSLSVIAALVWLWHRLQPREQPAEPSDPTDLTHTPSAPDIAADAAADAAEAAEEHNAPLNPDDYPDDDPDDLATLDQWAADTRKDHNH